MKKNQAYCVDCFSNAKLILYQIKEGIRIHKYCELREQYYAHLLELEQLDKSDW